MLFPVAVRQLVTDRSGFIVDDGMLHAERVEDICLQELCKGLSGNNPYDHRQQDITDAAIGILGAGRKFQSGQIQSPREHRVISNSGNVAGELGNLLAGAE